MTHKNLHRKKLSLSKRIENYIRSYGGWLNGGEIERLTLQAGYKASNGSRRCRELVEAGILERKEEKGSVWYRYIQQEKTIQRVEFIEVNGEMSAVIKQDKILV